MNDEVLFPYLDELSVALTRAVRARPEAKMYRERLLGSNSNTGPLVELLDARSLPNELYSPWMHIPPSCDGYYLSSRRPNRDVYEIAMVHGYGQVLEYYRGPMVAKSYLIYLAALHGQREYLVDTLKPEQVEINRCMVDVAYRVDPADIRIIENLTNWYPDILSNLRGSSMFQMAMQGLLSRRGIGSQAEQDSDKILQLMENYRYPERLLIELVRKTDLTDCNFDKILDYLELPDQMRGSHTKAVQFSK